MQAMGNEKRRHERVQITSPLQVIDTISDEVLGLVVNLSLEGLMLLGEKLVVDGAVYQIKMPLAGEGSPELSAGIECLWSSEADSETKNWSGYRIIDIDDDNRSLLTKVIEQF